MKRLSAIGIAALFLFVAACSSESSSSDPQETAAASSAKPAQTASPSDEAGEETPEPEPTQEEITYADLVSGSVTNAEICTTYSDLVERYTTVVAKRTKSLDGKAGDPYRAAKFVGNNGWVYEDLSVGFNSDWEAAATDALNAVSNGQAGTVQSLDDYREASLDACGLFSKYSDLESEISDIDRQQSSVVTAAGNKPWYPKSYTEYGSDLAWKYATDKGGDPCGYSRCTYGRVQVISRDGCPRGLYAEMNFLNSGGVVEDWSNDSVPVLGPGDKALLTFKSYTSLGSGSIKLVNLSCR